MIKWEEYLLKELALRRCIVIIGSGISKNSSSAKGVRPKTWQEFLIEATKKVKGTAVKSDIKELIQKGDYLTACEVIKDALKQGPFIDLMMTEFHKPGFLPAKIHESIFELDAKITITPNFDNIYDRYAQTVSKGTVLVKKHTDQDIAQQIRNNNRLIIKMHGSIDDPNHVVFTRTDYARARNAHKDFYTIMDALAITNTFLFLGCGTDDPDIRLMLEDYRYKFKFGREHYFVLPKGAISKSVNKIMEDSMNIRVLEYDPKDNHELLRTSITELAKLVESKRDELIANDEFF
jgi:hypothetical protein